jgi:phosphoribosylformylglycinamidine synthase
MVLAVQPDSLPALAALCTRHEVELSDIGSFSGTGRLVVRDSGCVVLDLDARFLHDGRPQRTMRAVMPPRPAPTHSTRGAVDAGAVLLALLAHPSVRSNADVVRGYDHEVLGLTVLRPYAGAADDGPSDAAVLRPAGLASSPGVALGVGVNARYGALDAERMARAVVDEAIRNVVAVGADPDRVALLDNFSWGDPADPETLGALVAAVAGCVAAAEAHAAPFVSGKDSLNNVFTGADGRRLRVPPTLVITAAGHVPDVTVTVGADVLRPGDAMYLVGRTREELRGSHLDLVLGVDGPGEVPAADPGAPARYRRLHRAIRAGLVAACHDLSEGGLAVAAAEMAIAGRLGLELDLPPGEGLDAVSALFSESLGRFLVEVRLPDMARFEGAMASDALRLGRVVETPHLRVRAGDAVVLQLGLDALVAAWQGHVPGNGGSR